MRPDPASYLDELARFLGELRWTSAVGELRTRTLGPRDRRTLGDDDVATVASEIQSAALVGETPVMSSRALLRCAAAALDSGAQSATPVLVAAGAVAGDGACPSPFIAPAGVDRLARDGRPLLVLVDSVHGCDERSVAATIELRKRLPDATIAAACDRAGAIALRGRGFRIVPVVAAVERETLPGGSAGMCDDVDDERLLKLACAGLESGGDPLVCSVTAHSTPPPVAAPCSCAGDTFIVRDIDRYSELLGRHLAEERRWWPRIATLDHECLAQPAFHQALDVACAQAAELATAGDWLRLQLATLELTSITSVCSSAVIVGALLAAPREGEPEAVGAVAASEGLTALVALRDWALREASFDADLQRGLGLLASGFDRCATIMPRREGERRPCFIEGVAQHPVTVEEFGRFVADGGYRDRRWWARFPEAVRSWSEPRDWKTQLRTPTHPVCGVSWYEATAYASYRSAFSGAPVEVTSLADHRSVCGAPYPWGSEPPAPSRLNFDQHVGRTTPVGTYRIGLGPAGHADLAGNVWEWCSDIGVDGGGVVCGGGWYTTGAYVTSEYSYRFHRENRFNDLGFRLARGEARA